MLEGIVSNRKKHNVIKLPLSNKVRQLLHIDFLCKIAMNKNFFNI